VRGAYVRMHAYYASVYPYSMQHTHDLRAHLSILGPHIEMMSLCQACFEACSIQRARIGVLTIPFEHVVFEVTHAMPSHNRPVHSVQTAVPLSPMRIRDVSCARFLSSYRLVLCA